MTDLVGKKKLIINQESWGAPERTGSTPLASTPEQYVSTGGSVGNNNGMFFLTYNNGGSSKGFVNQDNLRIALGRSWNEAPSDPYEAQSPVTVGNNWGPLNVFYNKPLEIGYCAPETNSEYPGFFNDDNVGYLNGNIEDPFFFSAVWREKVTINVKGLTAKDAPLTDEEAEKPELAKNKRPNFNLWSGFIKCGINKGANYYEPIIRNAGSAPGGAYYDHHHVSVTPFTPKEMLSKQPFGKSAHASVSTYYNSRLNSKSYEEELSSTLDWVPNSARDTFLPTPYGFLRMLLNKFEIEDLYDLESAGTYYNEAGQYVGPAENMFPHSLGTLEDWAPRFPLEILTTNFGRVPPDLISKFIKMKSKSLDLSGLYESYFNIWAASIRSISTLVADGKFGYLDALVHTIQIVGVNQRLSNLAFSPHLLKNLEKVHEIKKHFPFYSEIEFQTKVFTEIGDLIKQLLFTKFFVNKIAEFNTNDMLDYAEQGANITALDEAGEVVNRSYLTVPFFDYYSEHHYDNIMDGNLIYKTGNDLGQTVVASPKKVHNLIRDIKDYTEDPNYYGAPDGASASHDIQDYVTYVRHDIHEPMNVDEFNQMWKIVLGGVLKTKLLNIYKKHHRTFRDLMEGKPAYHEVVAYKIEKLQKTPGQSDDKFVIVQNFIIPNTSDLDLFKYVDTQLMYGKDKIYRYNVHEIKVVFGCKYNYIWHDSKEGFEPVDVANPDGIYKANNWQDLERAPKPDVGKPGGGAAGQQYSATFGVDIVPDIVLMEDLYFQSPDVVISDNPPVPPDVNIVPYRAINNKILILLDGLVDTYRAKPVIMLPGDETEYDFIKGAQMSPDDKVLFSSDDPVKQFQIFRTDKKPNSYKDFELYATIASTHYDEKISPNKRYYYTFRAVDAHGHISNPTVVYEVELIDDKGAVKPMIRVINFEEPNYSESVKECQKYLMIRPSLQQVYYDEKSELDHMFNGPDDTKKRKFKIRVTSKSTGKKLDINLAFNKKKVTKE